MTLLSLISTTEIGLPDPPGVVVVFNMHCLCRKIAVLTIKDVARKR